MSFRDIIELHLNFNPGVTMSLASKIKFLRGEMSVKDFAQQLGVTPAYIYAIESGNFKTPSMRFLMKVAEKFNVSVEWLVKEEEPDENAIADIPLKPIPIVAKVSAGYPEEPYEILRYESFPGVPANAKAMIVKGDSMSPTIRDGDYVIWIDKTDFKHNDIVIVADEWGDISLKRMKIRDNTITFVSDNPEYPSIVPNEHFRLIGKVIKIVRVIEPK